MRLLIVDDHLVWRKTLRLCIYALPGIESLDIVSDGYAALTACERMLPDIVFMDINLPDMDGFETARRLLEDYPQLWIICVSVDEDPAFSKQARVIGIKTTFRTLKPRFDELSAPLSC